MSKQVEMRYGDRIGMANIITSIRIICSMVLLFSRVFSSAFYILYIMAGITDVLDGVVARKFKLESKFGEKLDTAADICFVGATLYKLIPAMQMPIWLWLWIGAIVLIKLINIISGFLWQNTFVAKHTSANRITGILFFLFPFSLSFLPVECGASVVCAMGTVAAIHEGIQINTEK